MFGGVFNEHEYETFAQVAHLAKTSMSNCNDHDRMVVVSAKLADSAKYSELYLKHQPNNTEMHAIAVEIAKLADEFESAANSKMTPAYCKFKLNTIMTVSETAMDAVYSKRTQ
jgi:hypothetical protein